MFCGPSYRVVKEEVVKPSAAPAVDNQPQPAPPQDVTLAGCDEIYDHFQVKLAFFFKDLLPAPALKAALAQALVSFPMLAGRARKEGRRSWVDCGGQGVLVREQVGYFSASAPLRVGGTKPHLLSLCGSHMWAKANDPSSALLTVTLTEVVHSEGFTCRPCAISNDDSTNGSSSREEEEQQQGLLFAPPTTNGGGADGSQNGGRVEAALATTTSRSNIRYALGISFSHSVMDGCAFSAFLINWLLAQQGGGGLVLRPALNDRGVLLEEEYNCGDGEEEEEEKEEGGEEGKTSSQAMVKQQQQRGAAGATRGGPAANNTKKKFVENSWVGRAWVIARMAINQSALVCRTLTLTFTHDELEAVKTHAMQPLLGTGRWVSTSNALAAHLWPIVSSAWAGAAGEEGSLLCPMSVVVNGRKQLGLPPHYCGNVVMIQQVQQAGTHESLTDRALKVRAACAVSKEEVLADHTYLQRMSSAGRIHAPMHRSMRDAVLGRPNFGWDDVSSFQHQSSSNKPMQQQPPPQGSAAGGLADVSFAGGASPIGYDLQMADIPGMMFVMAPAPGHNLGGKEVRVSLPVAVAARLESREGQDRVHAYIPRRQQQAAS